MLSGAYDCKMTCTVNTSSKCCFSQKYSWFNILPSPLKKNGYRKCLAGIKKHIALIKLLLKCHKGEELIQVILCSYTIYAYCFFIRGIRNWQKQNWSNLTEILTLEITQAHDIESWENSKPYCKMPYFIKELWILIWD